MNIDRIINNNNNNNNNNNTVLILVSVCVVVIQFCVFCFIDHGLICT